MGLLTKLGVFGIKVSGMTYCCNYFHNVGIWGDSSKTYELYKSMLVFSKPYFAQLTNKVQSEFPTLVQELPAISDLNRCTTFYWNKAVITSIGFIGNSPCFILSYFNDGVTYLVNEVWKEKK